MWQLGMLLHAEASPCKEIPNLFVFPSCISMRTRRASTHIQQVARRGHHAYAQIGERATTFAVAAPRSHEEVRLVTRARSPGLVPTRHGPELEVNIGACCLQFLAALAAAVCKGRQVLCRQQCGGRGQSELRRAPDIWRESYLTCVRT